MLGRLKKRWWVNLALLALVATLVLLVVFEPGKKQPDSLPKLTNVSTDMVVRVRLLRPGLEDITLEKGPAGWRLSAPLKARANDFVVDNLLRLLSAEINATITTGGQAPGGYGLEPPRARVFLGDEEFAFGDLHPLKNQVYVRYRNQVYLVPGHFFGPAAYPVTRYLSPRLFEEGRQPVAFKLPGLQLVRKEGVWQREPADKNLSSDQINDFVQDWRNASALDVDRYSGKPLSDRVQILFEGEGGKVERLALGIVSFKPEFVVYREDEGLEYRFPEETGKRLLTLSAPSTDEAKK